MHVLSMSSKSYTIANLIFFLCLYQSAVLCMAKSYSKTQTDYARKTGKLYNEVFHYLDQHTLTFSSKHMQAGQSFKTHKRNPNQQY